MPDQITIQLKSPDMDDSRLQSLTRDLTNTLLRESVGKVSVSETSAEPGNKGDPVTIGNIIMTLIASGGVAVSLVQVLRAYVERKPSLHIELTRPNGQKVVLTTENLNGSALNETSKMVEMLLKG